MVRNIPKEYETGDKESDRLVNELVKRSASVETGELLREILTTTVKLGKESRDKGDLKLVNNALKELRYSFKVFSPYRNVKKAIIFGSARSQNTSAEYLMAEEFARKLTAKGYMIVTGGGPGVMEAGNKGSKTGEDFALNIRLPFEQKTNPYIREKDKIINFKYFFTRKLVFVKETDATALFPGGFGTQDEGFEMITLIQTGKSRPRPVVLMEPPGSGYWAQWLRFVDKQLVGRGYIKKEDLNLFRVVDNVDSGIEHIEGFYKVYHSIRYVAGLTVLRLNREVSGKTVRFINKEFKDILTGGRIEACLPTDKEAQEGEYLDLPRLSMRFNLRDYGRLCELISVINKDCP
ncbi:MAG: TIGR00730 family Rossman fold protein [Candidatus Omnitrophota bacterium]